MLQLKITKTICVCVGMVWSASAFVPSPISLHLPTTALSVLVVDAEDNDNNYKVTTSMPSTRKTFLAAVISTAALTTLATNARADDEGFESIAARAANMAKVAEVEEDKKQEQQSKIDTDPTTAYDFSLPVAGEKISFADLIRQEYTDVEIPSNIGGEKKFKKETKVKAILVVNIKQDDPIARKNIPELISLASKYVHFFEKLSFCIMNPFIPLLI
jgi:hypothetical protein